MNANEDKQTGFEIAVVVSKQKEGRESDDCVEILVLELKKIGLIVDRVLGLYEEFIK
ncbi:hypothetical protein FRX31_034036, partial [Thalictrum thalictroides]